MNKENNKELEIIKKINNDKENLRKDIAKLLKNDVATIKVIGDFGVGKTFLLNEVSRSISKKKGPFAILGSSKNIVNVSLKGKDNVYNLIKDINAKLDTIENLKNTVVFFDDIEKACEDLDFDFLLDFIVDQNEDHFVSNVISLNPNSLSIKNKNSFEKFCNKVSVNEFILERTPEEAVFLAIKDTSIPSDSSRRILCDSLLNIANELGINDIGLIRKISNISYDSFGSFDFSLYDKNVSYYLVKIFQYFLYAHIHYGVNDIIDFMDSLNKYNEDLAIKKGLEYREDDKAISEIKLELEGFIKKYKGISTKHIDAFYNLKPCESVLKTLCNTIKNGSLEKDDVICIEEFLTEQELSVYFGKVLSSIDIYNDDCFKYIESNHVSIIEDIKKVKDYERRLVKAIGLYWFSDIIKFLETKDKEQAVTLKNNCLPHYIKQLVKDTYNDDFYKTLLPIRYNLESNTKNYLDLLDEMDYLQYYKKELENLINNLSFTNMDMVIDHINHGNKFCKPTDFPTDYIKGYIASDDKRINNIINFLSVKDHFEKTSPKKLTIEEDIKENITILNALKGLYKGSEKGQKSNLIKLMKFWDLKKFISYIKG